MIDLIKKLLERDVKKRLGGKEMGGFESIKTHPIFKNLNWSDVEAKKAIPPFIPDV
jgi:hypothetical protein